jgi:hypothetical protein
MIKEILKKSILSTLIAQGLILSLILLLSLFHPNLQPIHEHRVLIYDNLFEILRTITCVVFLGALFEETMRSLQFFSAFKWLQRGSVIFVSIILFLIFFGRMDLIGIPAAFITPVATISGALGGVLAYIMEDISTKRNAAQINRRLTELQQNAHDS